MFLTTEGDAEDKDAASLENAILDVLLKSKAAKLDNDTTEDLSDVGPTTQVKLDVTSPSKATATEFNLSDTNDPETINDSN